MAQRDREEDGRREVDAAQSSTPQPGLRERVAERMLQATAELPVGRLSRLGRTALSAARGGHLLLKGRTRELFGGDGQPVQLDPEDLIRLVTSIGQLKGVAMKVGQLMSYVDVALPPELRQALSSLQTHCQPMTFEELRGVLEEELGSTAEPLVHAMERDPIAAASIGQVHCAQLEEFGTLAVKVQYPGIDRAIQSDFGAASLGSRLPELLFPNAHVRDLVNEARTRILLECDYQNEARLQRLFGELYADHPVLHVPRVFPEWSSRRVLTSSFVDGLSFDAYLESKPSQAERDRVGAALFEFYVGSLFRHGVYNCDPHPGNYLFTPDGRVFVLDYGCAREFDREFVASLARLTRAVHSDRPGELHAAFVTLGMVREGAAYDFEVARDLVRGFYGPMLVDATQSIDLGAGMSMREMADKKLELMKLKLPGEFLFLFRIRFGLLSVLARLQSRANWFRLEQQYLSQA